MRRIIVSVTNDLITDQRVHKICTTLSELNFDILLIGRKLSDSEKLNRNYKIFRFNLIFNKGFLFYAEYNIRLFFKLLFLKKDLLYSNDLDTLFPNYLISKILNKPLVYDSHELFTEVPELINRPNTQNIWLNIERFIIPKLRNCITVSKSIAKNYNSKYNTNFKVIRNLPQLHQTKTLLNFPFETNNNKIIIYQGAINKGRGLELIIETMFHLNNTILVIIGNGDIKTALIKKVKNLDLSSKIKFIPILTPEKLRRITPLADLGLSVEEDLGLNYKFALPNKLFDYIHANIPVLVSDLPEMKRVVEKYNVGEIIKNRAPKAIANQINSILTKKDKGCYNEFLQIAKKELNWEIEAVKLKKMMTNLN